MGNMLKVRDSRELRLRLNVKTGHDPIADITVGVVFAGGNIFNISAGEMLIAPRNALNQPL